MDREFACKSRSRADQGCKGASEAVVGTKSDARLSLSLGSPSHWSRGSGTCFRAKREEGSISGGSRDSRRWMLDADRRRQQQQHAGWQVTVDLVVTARSACCCQAFLSPEIVILFFPPFFPSRLPPFLPCLSLPHPSLPSVSASQCARGGNLKFLISCLISRPPPAFDPRSSGVNACLYTHLLPLAISRSLADRRITPQEPILAASLAPLTPTTTATAAAAAAAHLASARNRSSAFAIDSSSSSHARFLVSDLR